MSGIYRIAHLGGIAWRNPVDQDLSRIETKEFSQPLSHSGHSVDANSVISGSVYKKTLFRTYFPFSFR